jgi:hypothetical protein
VRRTATHGDQSPADRLDVVGAKCANVQRRTRLKDPMFVGCVEPRVRRDDRGRDPLPRVVGTDPLQQLESVPVREFQVEDKRGPGMERKDCLRRRNAVS